MSLALRAMPLAIGLLTSIAGVWLAAGSSLARSAGRGSPGRSDNQTSGSSAILLLPPAPAGAGAYCCSSVASTSFTS